MIVDRNSGFEKEIEKENPKPEVPVRSPSVLERLNDTAVPQSFENVGFHQGPRSRRKGRTLLAWSWMAATIDLLLLVGLTLISAAILLWVDRWAWGPFRLQREYSLIFSSGIFLMLSVIYMVMLRSFLGFTIGDWACGIRLGSALQRQSSFYGLRVALRTILICATGFLPLPILSLLTGRDWAGKITRLPLISIQ